MPHLHPERHAHLQLVRPEPMSASDAQPEMCGKCEGSGAAPAAVLVFRDVLGRNIPTSSYVYCPCKSGEALRVSHCGTRAARSTICVTHRHVGGNLPQLGDAS